MRNTRTPFSSQPHSSIDIFTHHSQFHTKSPSLYNNIIRTHFYTFLSSITNNTEITSTLLLLSAMTLQCHSYISSCTSETVVPFIEQKYNNTPASVLTWHNLYINTNITASSTHLYSDIAPLLFLYYKTTPNSISTLFLSQCKCHLKPWY